MLWLQIADPALAWQLRKDLFKQMDMLVPSTPGQKVLFWLRVPFKSRGIMNQAAMLAVAAKYNLSYTYALRKPLMLCRCACTLSRLGYASPCFPRAITRSSILNTASCVMRWNGLLYSFIGWSVCAQHFLPIHWLLAEFSSTSCVLRKVTVHTSCSCCVVNQTLTERLFKLYRLCLFL